MTFLRTIALIAAAVPFTALAQELPGIDLSQPPPERSEPAASEQPPPPEESSPPDEPSRREPGSAATRNDGAGRGEAVQPLGPSGERDVALGDRVKAVQRKGFMKQGRFEIAPIFSATVNDAFYEKFGGGLRLAYNLQDSFAIAIRGATYTQYRTDNVREGKLALESQLLTSQINQLVMIDGVWSPIYGKASFLQQSIIHFDLFLQAGFGAVWSATSKAPRDEGAHLAADLGGGVRFYPKEWLAFEFGLLATLYPDQPVASVPGTIQKVFTANFGVSFFYPFDFEYVYP
jgi:outer membrane beta-barrel protein